MQRLALVFVTCVIGFFQLYAQPDTTKTLKDYLSINGYVKEMQTHSFTNLDKIISDHLLHNRINMKIYPSNAVTIGVELRNRAFYGESIELQQPYMAEMLDQDAGEIDMSWVLVNQDAFVFHSTIDRANINYSQGNWDLRLGRQRINWGVNLAWNPNDLFNAYNFADFDYTERPGTDALRVQYYTGAMSSIDVAIKPSADGSQWIGAGMYKFNKFNYDFQVLGGWYNTDLTVGVGWAGHILKAGFKGEATYFHPQKNVQYTSGVVNASLTFDYGFENSTYINASVLYNSGGVERISGQGLNGFSTSGALSAKSLMPSKWTYFLQFSKPFNPALSGSLAVMYLQGMNVFFGMPSLGYTINEAWDVNLVGQLLAGEANSKFSSIGNSVFLRFQYSF